MQFVNRCGFRIGDYCCLQHDEVSIRMLFIYQREIDEVIGSSRPPTMKDKVNLPYTEACLLEIQRMADIAPLNIERRASQGIKAAGHIIPAGSTVIMLWYTAHRDPAVWNDPFIFDPGRFLNSDGQVYGRDRLMAFSIGKLPFPSDEMGIVSIPLNADPDPNAASDAPLCEVRCSCL